MPRAAECAIKIKRLDNCVTLEPATCLPDVRIMHCSRSRSGQAAASAGALARNYVADAAIERRIEMNNIQLVQGCQGG